jgi:endonuclease/exonuclease/phosphatase family metal-dependent hydrolase
MPRKKTQKKTRTAETKARSAPVIENDNISAAINEYVPEGLRGTDRFVDLVNWNIRYFNELDPARVRLITKIMGEINADIFVLQEIAKDAVDAVATALNEAGAGLYKTAYGSSGGTQRVAFMYDTEWVRTKEDFRELFADEPNTLPDSNKRIFPRLPLHNIMHAFAPNDGNFDFHLAGVHLKAYMGQSDPGTEQRRLSAERLVRWSRQETEDRDVIICGDFNKVPSAPEWRAFRDEEVAGRIGFATWNKEEEGSHWYQGHRSRIDLVIVSDSVKEVAVQREAKVIPWKRVFDSTTLRNDLIERISDHMPVVSRFYFRDLD